MDWILVVQGRVQFWALVIEGFHIFRRQCLCVIMRGIPAEAL